MGHCPWSLHRPYPVNDFNRAQNSDKQPAYLCNDLVGLSFNLFSQQGNVAFGGDTGAFERLYTFEGMDCSRFQRQHFGE